MANYIEVVDAGETFEFRPADSTIFHLRIVPDDVEKKIRRKCTSRGFEKGMRVEDFDSHAFIAAILDYCIVSWEGVRKRTLSTGEVEWLECTPKNKLLLPEALKSEINRLCLGKEAATVLAPEEADAEKKD